jgi:hypothetical protein
MNPETLKLKEEVNEMMREYKEKSKEMYGKMIN